MSVPRWRFPIYRHSGYMDKVELRNGGLETALQAFAHTSTGRCSMHQSQPKLSRRTRRR